MLIREKFFFIVIIFIFLIVIFQSCGRKEEPQTFIPPNQDSIVNKEKERKEREEFERLKNLQNGIMDSARLHDSLLIADTSKMKSDTSKISGQTENKKKFVQKEKELNKRLDNPSAAITDYIEFLKRGTSEGGNFELNMKKASELWQSPNVERFKSNYKNTTKLTVLEEPKVISQKGNEAVVEVKLKKTDKKNGKSDDTEMTVKYILVADSKGKWKIKDNTVVKK